MGTAVHWRYAGSRLALLLCWPDASVWLAGESTYFLSVNRNKRSICVDINSEKGKAALLSLARECDVVVENFIPGKLHSIGLGYEHFKHVNPKIIYASISGMSSIT